MKHHAKEMSKNSKALSFIRSVICGNRQQEDLGQDQKSISNEWKDKTDTSANLKREFEMLRTSDLWESDEGGGETSENTWRRTSRQKKG